MSYVSYIVCIAYFFYILSATNARLSHEGSLECDAWALHQLRNYQQGKLIMWSWISRGMVPMQKIAEWHFDNDLQAAELAMSQARDGMAKLYSLDDIPETPSSELPEPQVEDDNIRLEGEAVTFWAIADPNAADAEPIPLPQWFQLPIDNIILTWKKEHEIWGQRLDKRIAQGKNELPPKAKLAYESWMSDSERVLVLDKSKQAVVKNPEKKSQATLKRTCIALVIHPAIDSNDLWIKAGTGKKWTLKLLRGMSAYDTAIPAEIDHFAGGAMFHSMCVCVWYGQVQLTMIIYIIMFSLWLVVIFVYIYIILYILSATLQVI